MSTSKIPVTILTGFLGSGKTTLLNRILNEQHGKRIAVIENEFGEVGVDNELVIQSDEEIFEMNNGCICCTVRGDLIRILGSLAKRKNKFDYVLIETTGMADPGPVAQTFFMDDEVQRTYALDGIVTLVDAKHVWNHIDSSKEVKEQIGFADVIILNKIDLVSSQEVEKLEKRLASMNAVAKRYKATNSEIAIEKVLGIGAFNLKRALEEEPEFLKPRMPFEWYGVIEQGARHSALSLSVKKNGTLKLLALPIENQKEETLLKTAQKAAELFTTQEVVSDLGTNSLEKAEVLYEAKLVSGPSKINIALSPGIYVIYLEHCAHEYDLTLTSGAFPKAFLLQHEYEHDHEHNEEVSSVGIKTTKPVNGEAFNEWIRKILSEKGQDIFRSKGVLNINKMDDRFVYQGVHMLFDMRKDRAWKAEEERHSVVVFIGRNLDKAGLEQGFNACLL